VDDAGLVRDREALGNLRREIERLRQREGAALQPRREGVSLEVLHDEVVPLPRPRR
jgi:hypothetical protein